MATVTHSPPWPDFGRRRTLVLPLSGDWLQGLPERLVIDGIALARKPEVHLTLLDREASAKVLAAPGAEAVRRVFLDAGDWTVRPLPGLRLLRRQRPGDLRHSLVRDAACPSLDRFRDGLGLEPVPAHVTLYTAGDATGIGLPDAASLARLTLRRVSPRELSPAG